MVPVAESEATESALYMLARAEHHIADFRERVQAFFDSHPYDSFSEVDSETREDVVKLRLCKPFPDELDGIAADAVNNLRSALDQIVFATCVAANTGVSKTHFPFGDTPADVQNLRKRTCRQVPGDIFSFLVGFKPYRGGNDFLWVINKLCNANKHRLISQTVQAVSKTNFSITVNRGSTGSVNVGGRDVHWERGKNDVEIARFMTGNLDMDYNFKLVPLVVFDNYSIILSESADFILLRMSEEVDRIVHAVTDEGRRLGYFI